MARGWDIPWLCFLFPDFSRFLVTELASLTSLGEGQKPSQEHTEPREARAVFFQLPQPSGFKRHPQKAKPGPENMLRAQGLGGEDRELHRPRSATKEAVPISKEN